MRILFVENHEVFAKTVSAAFLRDHAVVIAPSLASVTKTIADERFDAALIDYDLDDCKGDEVVRLLRGSGFCGAILAVSSHDAGNAKLIAAGADASCPKLAFGRIAAILTVLFKGETAFNRCATSHQTD